MKNASTITFAVALLLTVTLSGCAGVSREQTPAPTEKIATPPLETLVNRQIVSTLKQVESLEGEIRDLRNIIEVQQFELGNLKKRQREFYDDLDFRVREQERVTSSAYSNTGSVFTTNPLPNNSSVLDTLVPALLSTNQSGELSAAEQNTVLDPTLSTQQQSILQNNTSRMDQTGQSSVLVAPSQSDATTGRDTLAEQAAYDSAFDLLKAGQYEGAIAGFENVIISYPDSEFVDDSYYWIGEAHYVTRAFERSYAVFGQVVNDYPNSQRVPDAMLKIGYIQYERAEYTVARQTLNGLVQRFPGSRVAISAETRLLKMDREGV